MVRRIVLVLSIAAMALWAPAPLGAATHTVRLHNVRFMPADITVNAGDTVVWSHEDGTTPHTVTADDGSFDSGNLLAPQTFSHAFPTPGTYLYYCKIHGGPGGAGMSGTVVVKAATQTTTTTVSATTTTVAPAPTTTHAPTTSTTHAPATSIAPKSTTTTITAVPLTVGVAETTSTTSAAAGEAGAPASSDGGGGGHGALVALLVVLALGVAGGIALVVRRLRAT